jgi:hypothetical protein
MASALPEVQRYRQRKLSSYLLLETRGLPSSSLQTFYSQLQCFVSSYIFSLPGIATQSICADLLGILKEILSYGTDVSGRSRRRSLMGNLPC